ncbi:hypothetical protein BKA61DRAFT_337472 [Leptodontidium sp. MPI-SDFR-AT-0119]|nr:hypothetical protein BKA61DRAFT_337472 [Leptodontidium sp. MPI-SDFR-AT-0119]
MVRAVALLLAGRRMDGWMDGWIAAGGKRKKAQAPLPIQSNPLNPGWSRSLKAGSIHTLLTHLNYKEAEATMKLIIGNAWPAWPHSLCPVDCRLEAGRRKEAFVTD